MDQIVDRGVGTEPDEAYEIHDIDRSQLLGDIPQAVDEHGRQRAGVKFGNLVQFTTVEA